MGCSEVRSGASDKPCVVLRRPAAPASLNRQDSDSKKPKAEPQKPPAAAAPPVTRAPAGADASKAPADITQPASSQAAAGAASKSLLVAGDFAELDTPPTVFKKAVPNFPSQPVKKVSNSLSTRLPGPIYRFPVQISHILTMQRLLAAQAPHWIWIKACTALIPL